MSAKIFIEGGETPEAQARCREAFRRLFDSVGPRLRRPRLVASGSRSAVFDDFQRELKHRDEDSYVAMLVDSEVTVNDIEAPWTHLKKSDGWEKPQGATDTQVLLMTTCMETWLVADRGALRKHFLNCLQESALPNHANLESVDRMEVQKALDKATKSCKARYRKGERSFLVVGKLDPVILTASLPSFSRIKRILETEL